MHRQPHFCHVHPSPVVYSLPGPLLLRVCSHADLERDINTYNFPLEGTIPILRKRLSEFLERLEVRVKIHVLQSGLSLSRPTAVCMASEDLLLFKKKYKSRRLFDRSCWNVKKILQCAKQVINHPGCPILRGKLFTLKNSKKN